MAGPRVETPYVQVALPLPLRKLFSYGVPAGLSVSLFARVTVPFGARRLTGYVVEELAEVEPGFKVRDLADVLDNEPLFDATHYAFFRWIARYYHNPLGEVIRAALPAGLERRELRMAKLTDTGRSRLQSVLDPLEQRERKALDALTDGECAVSALTRRARISVAQLLKLEQEGLLSLRYKRSGGGAKPRKVRFAVYQGPPSSPPVSSKEESILEAIESDGEVAIRELNRRFKRVTTNIRRLEASGAVLVEERRVYRDVLRGLAMEQPGAAEPPDLTSDQQVAVKRLLEAVDGRKGAFLLHGVTGSGKTEVYLRVIQRCLELGLGALVLVPEIALTPQLVGRFSGRFGDGIAVLHSGLSPGARLDQWAQIRSGERRVVVGARSAIFAPVAQLGVIIVDEEHESSFKQEERPRYNARDLALLRGQLEECPVVLGSATPRVESLQSCEEGKLERLSLPRRVLDRPLPSVEVIDLRRHRGLGPNQSLSPQLAAALEETVHKGEQAILFINRRGYSPFILCRQCGFVPQCDSCSISLSYSRRVQRLRCHYCDALAPIPGHCEACGASVMEAVGFGTERVEADVRELFGSSESIGIARMDRDTASGGNVRNVLDAFRRGETRVLIGTQMVAKGHDFPGVTLVGVLLADHGLKFPDFRASERTFQLLTQVAGRAGRGERRGRVLIQTFEPGHYSLSAACDHDTEAFLNRELPVRRGAGYPPYTHLVLVKITHADPKTAEEISTDLSQGLRRRASAQSGQEIAVLGPSYAPLQRIRGKTRIQILLKSVSRGELHGLLDQLDKYLEQSNLESVVSVDVDPLNLL